MQWDEIEKKLHTLKKAEGGYTLAHRGIITTSDGKSVFVKIGVDDSTKEWAHKEIEVYKFLKRQAFPFTPNLLVYREDKIGFALEALTVNDGWDWTNTWTENRLIKTLEAMDALANIKPSVAEKKIFDKKGLSESADGWKPLLQSPPKYELLRTKLQAAGYSEYTKHLSIQVMAAKSAHFIFSQDLLVHNDVRADNCAWNPITQTVRLIDWNWAQIGDRRIDLNAMLVHVYKAGLDIIDTHRDRLDADALQWLAGFWLNAAATPMWPSASENSHLREYQLESGIAALKLRDALLKQALPIVI